MSRRGLAACLALALAACGASAQTGPHPIPIEAEPVPLDRRTPSADRVGSLIYGGGLSLHARDKAFGGVSGFDLDSDGRFVAVTDAGSLIRGRVLLDAAGHLVGLADTTIAPLTDEQGRVFPTKNAGDAEDVTLLPDGGFAVAFEQEHRILVYPVAGPPRRLPVPEDADLGSNRGIEALTVWQGRLIVGAEGGDAWSCDLDGGDCRQILEAAHSGLGRDYSLTGLDAAPDGRLLAVYRGFSLFGGLRAAVAEIRPGEAPPVTVLARLAPGLSIDNLEAIAALPGPDGRMRLYLASDDNFSPLFRTLLLAFDWSPGISSGP